MPFRPGTSAGGIFPQEDAALRITAAGIAPRSIPLVARPDLRSVAISAKAGVRSKGFDIHG